MFLRHYEPVTINGRLTNNPEWAVGLDKRVVDNLRLHLTWVLKGEVFHWTDVQTGTKILKIFSELGTTSSSKFVSHVFNKVK